MIHNTVWNHAVVQQIFLKKPAPCSRKADSLSDLEPCDPFPKQCRCWHRPKKTSTIDLHWNNLTLRQPPHFGGQIPQIQTQKVQIGSPHWHRPMTRPRLNHHPPPRSMRTGHSWAATSACRRNVGRRAGSRVGRRDTRKKQSVIVNVKYF